MEHAILPRMSRFTVLHQDYMRTHVNVNVNILRATSESDFDDSGDPGPQAEGINHLETPLGTLTGPPLVQSEVVTCNCVRNPRGHS